MTCWGPTFSDGGVSFRRRNLSAGLQRVGSLSADVGFSGFLNCGLPLVCSCWPGPFSGWLFQVTLGFIVGLYVSICNFHSELPIEINQAKLRLVEVWGVSCSGPTPGCVFLGKTFWLILTRAEYLMWTELWESLTKWPTLVTSFSLNSLGQEIEPNYRFFWECSYKSTHEMSVDVGSSGRFFSFILVKKTTEIPLRIPEGKHCLPAFTVCCCNKVFACLFF